MFHFVKAKISGVNRDEYVQTINFSLHHLNTLWTRGGLCSESVVVLKQATIVQAFEDTSGISWWAWMLKGINLSLILDLKQLRKLNFYEI